MKLDQLVDAHPIYHWVVIFGSAAAAWVQPLAGLVAIVWGCIQIYSWLEKRPNTSMVVVPWIIWALIVGLAVGLVLYVSKIEAAPIYQATTDNAKVILTDEPCRLAEVSNLKKRATWTEKGEVFEGCWGIHQDAGVVLAYFSDKTVVIFPPQMFVPVSSI